MADRDPVTGQFAPGNKAGEGHGRPPRRVESAFQDAIVEAVRLYGQNISAAMVKAAVKGDVGAARFLAEYTIGKPPQILELRAADASLLAELLKRYDERGYSAGEVFNTMLALLSEEQHEVDAE